MSFREQVPDCIRFWIYILFLAVFQFSNGMYFTAMSQMQGTHSITMDDVKMTSHAVLIGLTFYFPLAFRLKFRFTNRTCLIIAAAGLLICNLAVPVIDNPVLLILVGYIAGFFRLFGTFECFSSILPKIAPTHNYAVFLSFVFFVVLGVIHVFDALALQVIYYYDWQHLHLLATGLMLSVILMAWTMMRPFRPMPKMPLYGIDWPGMILWSIFIMSLIFVAQYGYQLDWLHSPYIRTALGVSSISLAFNIWRMTYIRHPFLEAAAFRVNNLTALLAAFLFLGILLASKNTLQNTFTGAVLHWDSYNTRSLKWFEFTGAFLGAVFSWYALVRLKWSHKLLTFSGFSMILIYVASMYFLVSPATSAERLYLPLVCCNFGHVAIFIALTVYIQATAPFRNYFQVLCILGFVRTGIASPIGDAIYRSGMTGLMNKHLAEIGSHVSVSLQSSVNNLEFIGTEAMISTLQELYGYTFIFGIAVLILIALYHFRKKLAQPFRALESHYISVRQALLSSSRLNSMARFT